MSTPNEERAQRYSVIRAITMGDQVFEVFTYHAAPENTAKGVIRNISINDTPQDIRQYVLNNFNTTAIDAHRIGNSEAVIVLFQGNKVPSYIKYAGVLIRCYLYRQHREVCRTCGQIGHRKDVCPYPNARVCFACGKHNPGQNHEEECKPHCKLCGGPHPTGTKNCKNKFKTPYLVKKRQWNRKEAEEAKAKPQPDMKVRLSRKDEFPELAPLGNHQCQQRSRSRRPSAAVATRNAANRDRTKNRSLDGVTRANTSWVTVAAAGGGAKKKAGSRSRSTRGPQNEIQELKKMVREQQDVIAKLTKQLEEILLTGNKPTATTPWVQGKVPQPPSLTLKHLQQQPENKPAIPEEASEVSLNMEDEADRISSVSSLTTQTTSTPCSISCAVRIRRITERVDRLEKRVDALEHRINARFDRLENFLFEKLGAPSAATGNHGNNGMQQPCLPQPRQA